MKSIRIVIILVICIVLQSMYIQNIHAQHVSRLEIIDKTVLFVEREGKFQTTITVRNNGQKIENLRFVAFLHNEKTAEKYATLVSSDSSEIDKYTFAQFTIEFEPLGIEGSIKGFLVVDAFNGTIFDVVPLIITADKINFASNNRLIQFGSDQVVALSGALALFIFLTTIIYTSFKTDESLNDFLFKKKLGALNWDFKSNWASTFTAVGGILGILLGSKALPQDLKIINVATFQSLSALFTLMILIAPFIIVALSSIPSDSIISSGSNKGKINGLTIPFLLGSSIVVWAVLGEVGLTIILIEELWLAESLSLRMVRLLQGFLLSIGILGLIYMWLRPVRTVLLLPETTREWRGGSGSSEENSIFLP